MPPFRTLPNPQTSQVVSNPTADVGFPNYSFGYVDDYATAPEYGVENAETLPTASTLGLQFTLKKYPATPNQERAVTWEYAFPSGTVSAVSISLMGATKNVSTEFVAIDTGSNTAGEVRSVPADKIAGFNFLAIQVNSSTNTSGTVVAKFTL